MANAYIKVQKADTAIGHIIEAQFNALSTAAAVDAYDFTTG